MSEKRTVTVRRKPPVAGAAPSGDPHASQNRAPSRFSLPHLGQTVMRRSVSLLGTPFLPTCPNSVAVQRYVAGFAK
jgi:hypothetical protein